MGNTISERGLRLIATLKALSDLTDSENGVSAGELRDAVAQKASEYAGHPIDRPDKRTTWRDVETLKIAGYAVERSPGTRGKYSLSSNFEPWELRFLADATRTSRSLTTNQGNRIIEKLKAMAPIAGRDKLSRRLQVQQLYLSDTFKQTAYALEQIELALSKGWKISYEQVELDANGRITIRRDKRKGDKVRIVDPIEYVYSIDGYYYLIIFDPTTKSHTKTPANRQDAQRNRLRRPTRGANLPRGEIAHIGNVPTLLRHVRSGIARRCGAGAAGKTREERQRQVRQRDEVPADRAEPMPDDGDRKPEPSVLQLDRAIRRRRRNQGTPWKRSTECGSFSIRIWPHTGNSQQRMMLALPLPSRTGTAFPKSVSR